MKTCRVHDEPLYALTLDGSEIENVCGGGGGGHMYATSQGDYIRS